MTGYTFDQLFDFTRTTAGTFVGSNGLIQNTPASVNLLTFTQEFDNAGWTKLDATVTANTAIAPDGTSTADKLVEGTGASQHALLRTETVSSTPVTYSVYAKAAERSWVSLYIGAANTSAFFNLAAGTVGTVQASVTASITSVGDGWYRCSITAVSVGSGALTRGIYVANADNSTSYTGNGTSGVLIWGAQLELGSTATTYTRNNGGVFPARFDYDPVTLAPRGILIEEQRTNILTYSEQFDNGVWTKSATGTASLPVVTPNVAAAPDGTNTADLVVFDRGVGNTLTDRSFLFQGPITILNATAYTGTCYIKAASPSDIGKQLAIRNVAASAYTIITLTNSWQRVGNTETSSSTSGNFEIANRGTLTADNSVSAHLWGAQLEAGAFATSYIPTVASQVTRSADICTISAPMFAPWYNQSAGTFLVEYTQGSGTTARAATVASDGTNSNTVELYIDGSNDATTLPFYGVYVAGAAQAALSFAAATQNATHKMGAAYQANDFAGSVDGASVVTDTSGTLPTVNRLSIGSSGTAATAFANGHIRRITYYPFRASNNQLQQVTT
jgi:hypothetical protein